MSEEFLKQLPVKDLFELMTLTIDELLSMHKEGDSTKEIMGKQKEVELLQKIIVAKRANEIPLK